MNPPPDWAATTVPRPGSQSQGSLPFSSMTCSMPPPVARNDMDPPVPGGVAAKRIKSMGDLAYWQQSCPGYKDLVSFIRQLNEFCKMVHDKGLNRKEQIEHPELRPIIELLEKLQQLVNQVEPFGDDKNQRFGNKAYRIWFDKMDAACQEYIKTLKLSENAKTELQLYLTDSFGNKQRIDYGTGHELNFVIFLMGIYKLLLHPSLTSPSSSSTSDSSDSNPNNGPSIPRLSNSSQPSKEALANISRQLVTIFAVSYLPLCRSIQTRYSLEPAGSHGVFSLDDFQFLPFLFGSAQLIGHPSIEPKMFPEIDVAALHAEDYMFMAAIHYINQVKKGPFAEHSNQLWNISGVDDWSRINKGLFKMYQDEVLHKFPIVQHIYFGEHVLQWQAKRA